MQKESYSINISTIRKRAMRSQPKNKDFYRTVNLSNSNLIKEILKSNESFNGKESGQDNLGFKPSYEVADDVIRAHSMLPSKAIPKPFGRGSDNPVQSNIKPHLTSQSLDDVFAKLGKQLPLLSQS